MTTENTHAPDEVTDVAPTRSLFAGNSVTVAELEAAAAEPIKVEPATLVETPLEPTGIAQEPQEHLPAAVEEQAHAESAEEPDAAVDDSVDAPVAIDPNASIEEPVPVADEAVDTSNEAVEVPVQEHDDAEKSIPEVQAVHAAEDAATPTDTPKSVKELQAEKAKVDAELAARQSEEKKGVIAQIAAVVKTFNISVAELAAALGGVPNPRKGTKAPVLYRDGTNEWSGRGKLPKWLKDKNPEDYRVK